MPELPEVETVRRGLEPVLAGRVIAAADVRRPDLRWPFPERMAARLTGARVTGLRRRSKYLLADLDRGETMIVHLGMSGRILVSGAPVGAFHHALAAPEKHDHVVLDLDDQRCVGHGRGSLCSGRCQQYHRRLRVQPWQAGQKKLDRPAWTTRATVPPSRRWQGTPSRP